MSHFSVIVIGDNPEEQLAPFHEFECTGTNDKYVQDIDETEEKRKDFETGTVTRLKDKDGALHVPYDNRFYRDPTEEEQKKIGKIGGTGWASGFAYTSKDWNDGKGYRSKVRFIPEGWIEVEVPHSEVMPFAEYMTEYEEYSSLQEGTAPDIDGRDIEEDGIIVHKDGEHKYSYCVINSEGKVTKVIRRTNPNSKWDWYKVGGRWAGYFPLKKNGTGTLGEPSLIGMMGEDYKKGYLTTPDVDIVRKGDVDFESARITSAKNAKEEYEFVESLFPDNIMPSIVTWDKYLDKDSEDNWVNFPLLTSMDKRRDHYHGQPAMVLLREVKDKTNPDDDNERYGKIIWTDLGDYQCTKEVFIQRARDRALVPYAVVKDSVWYQKGEMLMFGASINEKPQSDWNKEVSEMFDALSDDTVLTQVDCHI